jgi:hypothetical protein
MYSTLILCLSMDPCLMCSSHFGHLLSEIIPQTLTRFHISQGILTIHEGVHVPRGIGHILQGTFGLFFHTWTSSTHATLEIPKCTPFSSLLEMFFAQPTHVGFMIAMRMFLVMILLG